MGFVLLIINSCYSAPRDLQPVELFTRTTTTTISSKSATANKDMAVIFQYTWWRNWWKTHIKSNTDNLQGSRIGNTEDTALNKCHRFDHDTLLAVVFGGGTWYHRHNHNWAWSIILRFVWLYVHRNNTHWKKLAAKFLQRFVGTKRDAAINVKYNLISHERR